ncbi:hypothetical protein DRP53_10560, partial [candidate division WOR-3 bacterium]
EAPLSFWLAPIPSPSVGGITIEYQISIPVPVRVKIFDPAGRLVDFWVERKEAGRYRITKGLPSGVYFLQLEAGGVRIERKVVIVQD